MPAAQMIRLDGVWLPSIAPAGDLSWSTIAPGSSEDASWRMNLPVGFRHPALTPGALVEIFDGPHPVWAGSLNEPQISETGWDLTALGLKDEGTGFVCLDGDGNTASEPDLVVDVAIASGLRWERPASLSAADFAATGDTDYLNKVNDLLDAWSLSVSKRWGVDAQRRVFAASDPTTPDWHLTPGAGIVSQTEDEYASDIVVRYQSALGVYETVFVTDSAAASKRRVQFPYDATKHGVITEAKAIDIGEGILAQGKARYAWTTPVTVSSHQLTTPGGIPARLALVRGGQRVRLHGIINEQGLPLSHFDFTIGRTRYQSGASMIELSPVEIAGRTLADFAETMAQAATR